MKVLLVNTFDQWGAANACLRLHLGLLANGVNSKVLLRTRNKNIAKTEVIHSTIKRNLKAHLFTNKIIRILKKIKYKLKLKKNEKQSKTFFKARWPFRL